jgi:eukaryotic-like serine/threonine-protein kinase
MAWKLAGYEPLALLGSGETGTVVTARHQKTGTVVAIKYLSGRVRQTPADVSQLRSDFRTLVTVENPHVARLFEYVESGRNAAVVMEYVEGASLRDLLNNGGEIDPEAAMYVLKGALIGLAEAHRRGIVHRDVKPENILLTRRGDAKLVDFGVAAYNGRKSPAAGTSAYMAPEQWAGHPAGPRTDVYAAAATFYECVAGHPPFPAGEDFETQRLAHESGRVPLDLIPFDLREFVLSGMAKDAAVRPATAADLLDELEVSAAAAYGAEWEEIGRGKLARRLQPLLLLLGAGAVAATGGMTGPVSGLVGGTVTTKALMAAGLVAALAVGAFAITGSSSANINNSSAPSFEVVLTQAPPVTIPLVGQKSGSPKPVKVDKQAPAQPTGLHVTGRSLTVVSLVWNSGRDNVGVVGYDIYENGRRIGTSSRPWFTATGLIANTPYQFRVDARDGAGNVSSQSAPVSATTLNKPDTTPPNPVTTLKATGESQTTVTLSWSRPGDNTGVTGYRVYRGGTQVATVTNPQYVDIGLGAATTYTYSVIAVDAAGNPSPAGNSVTATTLAAPDITAPTVPTGLTKTAATLTTISLSWTASTDAGGVTGYDVFRGSTEVGVNIPAPSFQDTGLDPGVTYAYSVEAVDASNNVSDASAALSAATTSPAVSKIDLAASAVGGPPGCGVPISATVTVTASPIDVDLKVTIDGTTSTETVSFVGVDAAQQAQTVSLGSGDGTANGTASASDSASGKSGSASWTAPTTCKPGFAVGTITGTQTVCDDTGGTVDYAIPITTYNYATATSFTITIGSATTTASIAPNSSQTVDLSVSGYADGSGTESVTVDDGSNPSTKTASYTVDCTP